MRFTRIHINAWYAIAGLMALAGGLMALIHWGDLGCNQGEAVLAIAACIAGIVWCAKAFAAGGHPDSNGEES